MDMNRRQFFRVSGAGLVGSSLVAPQQTSGTSALTMGPYAAPVTLVVSAIGQVGV